MRTNSLVIVVFLLLDAFNSGVTLLSDFDSTRSIQDIATCERERSQKLRAHAHGQKSLASLLADKRHDSVLVSYCENPGMKQPSITDLPQNGFPRTWGTEAFGISIHSAGPPDGCALCEYNFTTPPPDLMVETRRIQHARSIPLIMSYIDAKKRAEVGTVYGEHFLLPPRANPSTYGLRIPANVGTASLHGEGAIGAVAGEVSTFRVSILRDISTNIVTLPRDITATPNSEKIFVAARIVGSSIEPCVLRCVFFSNDTMEEIYEFSYQVEANAAGVYGLEVRVTNSQSLNHIVHRGRICIRHPKPSVDQVVIVPVNDTNSTISKKTAADAINLDLKLCASGNSKGRWVNRNVSVVNDQYGYNDGYYWQPYDCKYRAFNRTDISKCFGYKNVKTIGFSGDSLARELMSSLNHFMEGMYFNGRDFKPAWSKSLSFGTFDAVWLGAYTEADLRAVNPQIYVFAPRIVTALGTDSADYILATNLVKLNETWNICKKMNIRMIFYANPTIQHGSLHLRKLHREAITDEAVSKIVKPLMQLAQDLQIEILDGRQITEARWYASHDGIHYTWSSFENELRPTTDVIQWQGGVSWMTTTVLLNMICNNIHSQG